MKRLSESLILTAAFMLGSCAHAASELSPRIAQIATERCDACHGGNGQGTNAMFPKLAGQNADYLTDQISKFKSGLRHSFVMRFQLVDLSDTDVAALAGHYNGTTLRAVAASDSAQYEAGRAIYAKGVATSRVAACASCHGPNARGGQGMPRLAGQHADYIADQLIRFADGSREKGQTLTHPVASRLSDSEIESVSYFLSTLN